MRCCWRGGGGGDPDQAVEDADKNIFITLFSSSVSGAGYSEIMDDIGVAYALDGVVSSFVITVVVDIAGVVVGSIENDW